MLLGKLHLAGLTLLSGMLLCACSRDALPGEEGDGTVRLSAEILARRGEARAVVGGSGNESFIPGDRITLFMTPTGGVPAGLLCRMLTLAADGWTPKLAWSEIVGERVVFSAVYPETECSGSNVIRRSVAIDQRDKEKFAESDLLVAYTEVPHGNPVALSFSHQLSLVEVNLTSKSTFTPEQLSNAIVRVRACRSFDFQTAPVPQFLGLADDTEESIIFHRSKSGSFHIILPPQPVRNKWRENWIEIGIEGKTYTWGAPENLAGGEPFSALNQGQRLKLNINLDRGQITEDWSNKTVWVCGVKNIPPLHLWNYATDDGMGNGFPGLKWSGEYGWFDCNKKNPMEGTGLDSNMCWAASCSNMIYWWLEQNAEYVARYGYSGPDSYGDSVDSDVFDLYRSSFQDTGNDVGGALSWFFSGRPLAGGKESPAYFKDLVGENKFIPTVIPIYANRSLSDELKKIFKAQKSIECTISTPRLIHAVNIWGAEFDENGEVAALYITDNNDTDLYRQPEGFDFLGKKKTQAGLLYKPVKLINGKYYMEGSIKGNYSLYINELTTLDLMRDKWEAFFGNR